MKKSLINKKAFSLVELIIVIGVGSILIASLASIFVSQSKTYSKFSDIGEVEQSARAVLDYMAREIRMAGAGMLDKDYKFRGGISSTGFVHISSINSNTSYDAIRIRGNFQGVFGIISTTVGGTDINDEAIKVSYKERSTFSSGNFITINDRTNSEIRKIISVSSDKKTISFANGDGLNYSHKNGTIFNGIQELRYFVDSTGTLRRNNFETNGNQPILENVEALQFQYGVDVNNDGIIDGWANYIGETINVNGISFLTNISMVKQINIWLLVRGTVQDENLNDSKTYNIADLNYQPPSELRKYRRILFNTTVTLRNFKIES